MLLVADVGGTHIRLGVVKNSSREPVNISKLRCADSPNLLQALNFFIDAQQLQQRLTSACIAVAGPVNADQVKLTNLPWQFSQTALQRALALEQLVIINDFAAVALAIPYLGTGDCLQVGGGVAEKHLPIVAFGPGTGLGAALVVPCGGRHIPVATEAGHAFIGAETAIELNILNYFATRNAMPEREFFLSGNGLQSIYNALCALNDVPAGPLSAAEIQHRACDGSDPWSEQALHVFCAWLGATCADQALSCGARGGVYLAGGMLKRFLDFFVHSEFRQRFETRGALHGYLQAIPTYVITRDHVALLGAANVPMNEAAG